RGGKQVGHDDPMLHGKPHAGEPLPPTGDLNEDLAMSSTTAAGIALAHALLEISLPPGEVAAARERVWARLLQDLARDEAPRTDTASTGTPAPDSGSLAPRVWRGGESHGERHLARSLLLIAAMLLIVVATGVGVSLASASALPSSSLYGIKRAEEWLA